jgi:zinc protease
MNLTFFRRAALRLFFAVFLVVRLPLYAEEVPLFRVPLDSYGGLGLPGDPVPNMAGLRTGTLPNGLRYYILENALPKGRAYLTLAVNAGSVLENEDERGLAHFTEHMAFNGTRRFPETELVNYLRSLGMRFGPEVNAYTSYDRTVYGIEAPTETDGDGIRRIPEKALEILDDWTWAITFNSKDVDDERAIIMEEYRSYLGAQQRIREKMLEAIFRGSRYASRLAIGLPAVIKNAPAEKLEAFYRRWYRNDNMAVILVGDFDGKVLEKELASRFSSPGPKDPLVRPGYELPPPHPGSLAVETFTDPEFPYATVYLYYKRSYRETGLDLRTLRSGVIDYLVTSMTDVRNEDAAVREDCPFIGAQNWGARYGKLSRYYIMAAQAKLGQTGAALEALLLEKESLLRYGFTQGELDRAKASFVSSLEFQVSEKDKRESSFFVETFTEDFLANGYTLDIEWEAEAVKRLLPGISLETVNAAVKSYYEDDDLLVILAAPETEDIPGREDIQRMAAEIREAALSPPRDAAEKGALVDEEPEAGFVAGEREDESGAVVWTLNNGMQIILKETNNRNNALNLYALARGGQTSVPLEDDLSAYLAPEIQAASGVGPFTRPELSGRLSDKQISLGFWTNPYTRGFYGQSSLSDLESFFQLLYLYFTQPKIDDSGVNLVREATRTRLIQEKDNPETVFSQELTRLVYGNHPRFKPLELEDLDGINGEKAAAFLKKSLDPSVYTFVFAGNLGPRQGEDGENFPLVRRLAETWLGSIPASSVGRWDSWDDPGVTRPGKTEKIVRKGREQKCMVYMVWFSPDPWNENKNAAALILNEYLDIVLTDEIREKLGGVYSVSGSVSFTPIPQGELSLGIYFVCDPDRSGELRAAVKEQLAGVKAGNIDAEIFERAKKAVIKKFALSMENNAFIARNYASFSVILDTPLSRLDERPVLYGATGAEEVRELMAKILENGPAELVLLPE